MRYIWIYLRTLTVATVFPKRGPTRWHRLGDRRGGVRRKQPGNPSTSPNQRKSSGIIKSLKSTTAPGDDNITNKHLKELPRPYIKLITKAILENQTFSKRWKYAVVILIPKPDKDLLFPQNHWPISLLSSLSRVVERVVLDRVQGVSHDDNSAPFLDIKKAFDRVWHERLIYKLISYNFLSGLLKLTHPLVTNRLFPVRVGSSISTITKVRAAVPRGSTLSLIL